MSKNNEYGPRAWGWSSQFPRLDSGVVLAKPNRAETIVNKIPVDGPKTSSLRTIAELPKHMGW